jgi:ATP-binding cassette subfamily C (CFTR/MRP) protein 4
LKGYVRGVKTSLFLAATGFAVFITLLVYIMLGEELNPSVMFASLSLLVSAQFFLTIKFPLAIEFSAHYIAGSQRFAKFLLHAEKEPIKRQGLIGEVLFENVCAYWGKSRSLEELDLNTFMLNEVSLHIQPGELIMVTGPVASGKSSFLLSILGELNVHEGSANCNGTIAYVD